MSVPILNNKALGLYLHIPYCRRKCPYCSFESQEGRVIPEREYTDCLKTELENVLKNQHIGAETILDSIYFGGGTPSLFEPSLIGELIESARAKLTPTAQMEVTLEVNPDSAEPERLKELRKVGVNRLSIGIQSLNDSELKELGRLHDSNQATDAFVAARTAGFTNISVDIITGAPSQSKASLSNTLDKIIELRPEHISAYCLTIEDDTQYCAALKEGRLTMPDEEAQRDLHLMMIERLEAAGFKRYEISNFALPGMESRHNSRYWTHEDYIGLGASAHSYTNQKGFGKRWWNVKNADEYISRIKTEKSPVAGFEKLTKEQARTEAIMLGLRQTDGIDEEAFARRFSAPPIEFLTRKDVLKEQGLICSEGGRLKLTKAGLLLSNEVY
jgi:oxygen-independent coproporphyrinogen-3 oxidase